MTPGELREKAKIIDDVVYAQKMNRWAQDPSGAAILLVLTTQSAILKHLADLEAFLVRN